MTMRYITIVLDPPRRLEDSDEVFDDKAEQLGHDQKELCDQMNDLASDMNDAVLGIEDVATDAAAAHAAATAAANAKTAAESARDNAATSASAAAASATAAGTAKTSAESARDTATTKASESSTSATAAGNAKTAAESARDTAITKAGEASTSATNASNAKTAAESARDTAITKAGEASTSATAASNAKTSAESARDTAITKAGEASTSATAAATSATNAANSAAAAAQSAQDAADAAVGDILSSSAPQALGAASAGSAVKASRDDHVHPMPTAANVGAAPAAHVGAGGAAHADATTSVSGFMSGADKTKLAGIAANATANATDAQLRDRSTHTGTQAISTVSGLQSALDGKQSTIASGTTAQYWRGDKTWQDFAAAVRGSVLTGLSLATNAAVTAADSVLSAIGKLQKQISDHFASTSNPHSVTAAQVGAAATVHSHAISDVTGLSGQLSDLGTKLPLISASTRTLALSDAGQIVYASSNITIPSNSSVAFPVGTVITLVNSSSTDSSVSITTDTLRHAGTTNTGTRTLGGYGVATLLKVSSTQWMISGAGLT